MDNGTPVRVGQDWPKVIFFGDSLIQRGYGSDGCWVSMVADTLVRKCDVLNRGFSGYNTVWCSILAESIFTRETLAGTAAFVLFLGCNDANRSGSTQHVPVAVYQEKLVSIVQILKKNGLEKEKIIIMTPPPLVDEKWHANFVQGVRPTRFEEDTPMYVRACQTAADHCQVECVNLHEFMKSKENWRDFLGDGLHFSAPGSAVVHAAILPSVLRRTQHLPMIGPLWSAINIANPQTSIHAQSTVAESETTL